MQTMQQLRAAVAREGIRIEMLHTASGGPAFLYKSTQVSGMLFHTRRGRERCSDKNYLEERNANSREMSFKNITARIHGQVTCKELNTEQ